MKIKALFLCLAVNVFVATLFLVFTPLWLGMTYAVLSLISIVHSVYVLRRLGLLT